MPVNSPLVSCRGETHSRRIPMELAFSGCFPLSEEISGISKIIQSLFITFDSCRKWVPPVIPTFQECTKAHSPENCICVFQVIFGHEWWKRGAEARFAEQSLIDQLRSAPITPTKLRNFPCSQIKIVQARVERVCNNAPHPFYNWTRVFIQFIIGWTGYYGGVRKRQV